MHLVRRGHLSRLVGARGLLSLHHVLGSTVPLRIVRRRLDAGLNMRAVFQLWRRTVPKAAMLRD